MSILSRLSGDENSALRLATSSRDEISLLSLSLVSHENHHRRRLLECRSPLLLLFCSSTIFSSSTSIDDHHLLFTPSFLLETILSFLFLSYYFNPIPSFFLSFYLSFFLCFSLFNSPPLSLDLLLKFNGVHRGTYYIYRFMIRNA